VPKNRDLLIPIRIELDPALLHQHAAEMPKWVIGVTAKVAPEFASRFVIKVFIVHDLLLA
jgi:hypothetical protein